jgi:lipopolysaccharide/colanic/teichoic acid biosynthesis glycosyltransferase
MLKRLIDMSLGAVLALSTLPLVLILALAVALTLRAQPFFIQERIGRNERTYRIIKLRTLPPDTPQHADKYALRLVQTNRLCRMLPKFHLDELPQLFLVPLGRMSLVGPRPEMPILHRQTDRQHAKVRTTVRPGCTGLWQISPDSARLIREAPEYDLFYVYHRNVRLDFWILWRTLFSMLGIGQEARLQDIPTWARRWRAKGPEPLVIDLTQTGEQDVSATPTSYDVSEVNVSPAAGSGEAHV